MKKIFILLSLLTVFSASAFAQGPAVSAINGKADITGGNLDGDGTVLGSASVSIPLGERLGLQLDAAFGDVESNDDLFGGAVHLFARDPELYLVGLTAVYAEFAEIELERYGAEAEGYFGQFTVAATAGLQTGNIDDSGYGSLDLRYYPMDNLMLEVGTSLADSDSGKAHVGAEYLAPCGFAVYADLATGEDGYEHIFGGVRYYFGADKSLLKRHREDDPSNIVLASVVEWYVNEDSDPVVTAAVNDGGDGDLPN